VIALAKSERLNGEAGRESVTNSGVVVEVEPVDAGLELEALVVESVSHTLTNEPSAGVTLREESDPLANVPDDKSDRSIGSTSIGPNATKAPPPSATASKPKFPVSVYDSNRSTVPANLRVLRRRRVRRDREKQTFAN
jgi:hypothetical protein